MFVYEKKLEYPVRIRNANPALAKFICSQYGGPDGELGASLRYLSQRYAMPYPELSALLTDIGTEAAEMALQIEGMMQCRQKRANFCMFFRQKPKKCKKA